MADASSRSFEAPEAPIPSSGRTLLGPIPLLLLALATLLRVLALGNQEASIDEVSERAIASSATIRDVILAGDGFPPLFNLVLRFLSFGSGSVMVARVLSVVASTLALLPFYLLARRLAGTRAANLALLLAATNPFLIWFAQEGRAYSFFFLFTCLSLAAFFRALETDDRFAWATFVVSSLLGCLTHYYFAILPAVAALLLLVRSVLGRLSHPRRRAMLSFGAWAIGFVLPLLLLRADLAHQSQYSDSFSVRFDLVSFGYSFFSFLHGMAVGPSVRRLHTLSARDAIGEFAPWIALSACALALILFGLVRCLRKGPTDRNEEARLSLATAIELGALVLVPVCVAGAASLLFDVHYKPSYSIDVVAPLLILLAAGLARLSLAPRALSLALLLSIATVSLAQRNLVPAHQNEELGALSSYMSTHADPEDTNLVMSAYVGAHLRQSFRGDWKIWLVPNAGCDREGLEKALAEAELRIADAVTPDQRLIYSRPFHGDPCGNFLEAIGLRYDPRLEAVFIGAEVYVLRRRPSPTEATRPGTSDRSD